MNCPECQGTLISPDGKYGEIVCENCGSVITNQTRYNEGFTEWTPEWHSNWDASDSGTMMEWLTALRTVSCQLQLPEFPYREEVARIIRKKKTPFSVHKC